MKHGVALIGLALLLAGCGAPAGSSSAPGASTTSAASKPAAGSAKPAASGSALASPPSARLSGGDPNGYPIRISYPSPAVSALYYYVGLNQGFFAQQHLNVTMIQMAQSVVPAAHQNGEIDFNDTMPIAIEGAARGLPLRGILATWSHAPWTVYGKPEFKTLQDLKGHVLGTNQVGSSPYLYLQAGLKKAGMSLQDLQVVSSPATQDTYTFLLAGKVEAAVLSPPFDAEAEEKGFHEIQPLGDALMLPFGGVGSNVKFLTEHRPQTVAFIRAMLDAGQWLKAHPDEAAAYVEKYIGVSHATAVRSAHKMAPLVTDNGEYSREVVQSVLDSLVEMTHTPVTVTADQVVDYGPLHEALAK
ncbi:MAG TPA: ABC transporter substrate-binding protein [Chloroflexota bacterium]|nr:ABC transporter substrate-binding protein [Chloroflexota bacterium]